MTGFEIYVFILCLIVFSLLTAMFTYLISYIVRMEIKFIRFGHRDETIKKEYEKELNKNKNLSRAILWSNKIISLLFCAILIAAFVFAIYVRTTEDKAANGIPSIKVVKSESMAKKNEKNTYLFLNHLDNQFQMFDVVICHHLPAEDELELYDVVIYRKDDVYVIHRIVGIEEPNEKHPNERQFLLQGDAVDSPDSCPVLYSQMQGIYEGDRIQYVGSFLLFLQSPAGWLCILLVVFAIIITPIVEKLIDKEKKKRIALLFPEPETEEKPETEEAKEAEEQKIPQEKQKFSHNHIMVFRHNDRESSCEIGTSVINYYYQDGDTVDIYSLKEKHLVKPTCKHFKVISTCQLRKRVVVHTDSCSEKARLAVTDVGGSLLQDKEKKPSEVANDD